jgi:glycosyltransferase involved in cell wall biosynthesis
MRATVVIPARDAARTLPETLDALADQDLAEPFEVIVVDNGSNDDTPQLASEHPRVDKVLRRERGAGPGAARNDGVAAATGPVIAFTDSDCVPSPAWLREGLAAMDGADLVQGQVLPVEGIPVGPFDHTLWVTSEYGLYETANLLVRREWFDRVGGFEDVVDTRHERPFGEDALFAWRARRAGARTAFAPGALIHHAVFPGTPEQYLDERRRDRHFATLADLIPELREVFFYRRFFLNRRSAAFAAAAAATVATRKPAALLAFAPWALLVKEESKRRTGVASKRVAVTVARGDAIAFAGLLKASINGKGPLL